MRTRIAVLFLSAVTLCAQYYDLAVTDDGRLYFSTQLLTGSDQDSRYKVYKYTSDGLSLVATGTGTTTSGPSAIMPLTSGDGSVTGYALNYPCLTGSCGLLGLPRTFFQIQGAAGLTDLPYTVQVSRNAAFLLATDFSIRFRVIELPGQVAHVLPQSFNPAGTQAVANNGSVLMRDPRDLSLPLMLVPLGKDPVPVAGTGAAFTAILSPDGTHIAFDRRTASTYDLILTDAQGSNPLLLGSVPLDLPAPWPVSVFRYQPSFANDGTLLYLEPNGAAMLAPGADPIRLNVEGSIQNAILSGNGQIAWLATYKGQLLRVHTQDGAVDEVIPETAFVAPDFPSALPGSVIRLIGAGLTANTKFLVGNNPIPLSDLTAGGAAVQLPWEYDVKNGPRTLKIQGPASPFFQQTVFFPIDQPYVMFESTNFGKTLQIAHQDFRGILNQADPAVPGETIHVFARNLGAVDKPVATGQRAPADPQPSRITSPLACYLFNDTKATGLEVPFAGLTAGAIGVYHIDVTIPSGWDSSNPKLSCQIQGADGMLRGDSATIFVHPGSR